MLCYILLLVTLLIVITKIYQKLTCGICRSSAHMVGKTVIITGGNSGIGLETAKNLAARGARVIITCESIRRGITALEEIVQISGNSDVHCKQLDLSSLRSVKDFCHQILTSEKRLDVLINNAGVTGLGNYKTADGLHIGMQVNYFGPFLLTCLLLPLLKSSAPSRIVNVSSVIHKYGELDFENLNMEKYWSDYLAYANSKLFLNLMTLELSYRLKGTGVTVNALHPGVNSINIHRNINNKILRKAVQKTIGFIFRNTWEASQTSIFLAVAPELGEVTGRYFSDCYERKPSKLSQNSELAKKVWSESEKIVKFSLVE